jgi:hypothetical protein
MKKLIILFTLLLVCASFAQGPTSNLTLTVNFTGAPNQYDAKAARFMVDQENAKGGSQLPTTPAAALKASYLTVLGQVVMSAHQSYIEQALEAESTELDVRALWKNATDAQRAAALAALQN